MSSRVGMARTGSHPPPQVSSMIWPSAVARQHILRHLMSRKRHVILQPPGQETEHGSRDKLHLHGKGNGEVLLGWDPFARFGLSHLGNIILEQLLKPANPFSTEHQLVEMLMLRHMFEQLNKIGSRTVEGERAGWQMLLFCYQSIIHLPHPLLQQGVLIRIMLIKRSAMHHSSLT